MAFPWLLSIGFTTTFSALFSKIWRLNKVFHNARHMRRVVVKEKDVILPFAILMTVNCALMLAWTLVDPLLWFRTEPNDAYESQGYCRAEGDAYIIFLILIAIVNFLALVLANIQAFRARNITTEFSESLYVMMTMVSLLQALVIGVPLLVIVHENPVAGYFICSGLIFVVTTAILGLMFVPKMYLVRQRARDGAESSASRNTTRHSQPDTENQNNTHSRLSHAEQAPEIVIVDSRSGLESGNHTVMTGKF